MKRLFLTTLLTITVLFAGVYGLINRVPSESIKVDAGTSIAAPLAFIQQARLISGATADSFSTSVAISGSTAVVYSASGFFVFFRSDTTWSQQAVLVPSSGMGVASGNRSVAIDGDTIVIGGSGAEIIPGIVQGAAYVFVRNGSTWTEQQRLAADDGAAGDNFGRSVAINGGTIVVGANTDDVDPNGDQGSAYVFARSGGIWSQQARLIASDGEPAHGFGINVAIDVDTVIVSSRIGSVNGSIYVFFRTGATWSEQQRLSNCEPSGSTGTSCNFGAAISISGDTIAAGNRSLNVDGRTSQGGVYIFVRNATTWTLEQKITDSNGAASDGLGNAVSLSGNSLAVSTAAVVTPLAVYIYGRSGSTWSMSQPRIQFPAQTTVGLDRKMVSISGNRFIFGVSRDITSPNVIGAAYIHWNGVEDPTPTPTPTPTLTPTPTISPTPTPSASPTPPLTVSVSGRVTTPGGLGLRNAVVSLTNSQNVRQTATTSSFGVYSFGNVMPGEIYVVGVSSKRYRFASQSLVVNSDMTNVDFVGLE